MKDKTLIEIDRIIEMAWEDRTPFEAIFNQFEINEKELISLMRNNLKRNSSLSVLLLSLHLLNLKDSWI